MNSVADNLRPVLEIKVERVAQAGAVYEDTLYLFPEIIIAIAGDMG